MNQQEVTAHEESTRSSAKIWKKYRKYIVITAGITALNLYFGFDARFTLINLLWLLV